MYTTVREELQRMAELRELLAGHYASVATHETLSERVRGFLDRLSHEEEDLARGIREFAQSRCHVSLDAWVQFPTQMPEVVMREPTDLSSVLELASDIDAAMAQLCRPVAAAGSQAVSDWCENLVSTIEARKRNRARVLALEESC